MDEISTPYISREDLIAQKRGKTYDELVEDYGINRWQLWNIIEKEGYKPPHYVKVKLGWVSPPPPRIAIRKDDVESAARSIARNCTPEFRRELARRLRDGCA